MPQLMHLRQRIQATATIRKTTNAMRLVAMSTHARLRNQKMYLERYKDAVDKLYGTLAAYHATEKRVAITNKKQLIILIGSQKGLCGNFNTALLTFFQHTFSTIDKNISIITVGKQITDYIRQIGIEPRAQYNEFNASNFVAIAHELTLTSTDYALYQQVTTVSTQPITFFIQKQLSTMVIPFKESTITHETHKEYIFEQQPTIMVDYVQRLQVKTTLEMLLFESLLAEQAARFLSMDLATRNADTMMVEMKRDYNKMRQAAITLELIDFSSNVAIP
jgi:F-type H+-transporting ATPase subunit gamma